MNDPWREKLPGAPSVPSPAVGPSPNALPPDQPPWLEVARAVNAGQHDLAETRSEVQALLWGVRSIRHPECQTAAERLRGLLGTVGGKRQ
jgi:hypothetical protein